MSDVECPKCHWLNLDVEDFLPSRACDDADFTCFECDHTFKIGWYAEVEVRDPLLGEDND